MDQLVTDNPLYNYNFTMASIARAISTILWLLLLVIPLIQVSVYNTVCAVFLLHVLHCHSQLVRAFVV